MNSLCALLATLKLCCFHPQNPASRKTAYEQVRQMKTWPYYQKAIAYPSDRYLSFRKKIFKLLLKLPWIWPLELGLKVRLTR